MLARSQMRRRLGAWLALSGLVGAQAMEVFACEPEWGALAAELGGDKVTVFTATTALQDPHQIQARPALIARLRAADLVVCTGAELEIGWMPVLLRQNGRQAQEKLALADHHLAQRNRFGAMRKGAGSRRCVGEAGSLARPGHSVSGLQGMTSAKECSQ